MAFDTIMMEHDQLQMLADFNQSIIEAVISFEDKKNNMRSQGYSEAQILQEEDGFWGSIGKAYDRGKAGSSNSTWEGIKAGAKEFGRQLVKLLKGLWAWLKKSVIQILNIFKNDKQFINKYETVLTKAWADNKDGLSQLKFNINKPSREIDKNLDAMTTEAVKYVDDIKLWYEKSQKPNFKDNQKLIRGLTTDQATNQIEALQQIRFNEKMEISVGDFISGKLGNDYPKNWPITSYTDIKGLMKAFTDSSDMDVFENNVATVEKAISQIEKNISGKQEMGANYNAAIKIARLSKAIFQIKLQHMVMQHKNEKACLITCIAGRRNEKQESAMVLAESFVEASSVEIDNQMAVLDEFWAPYENLARQLSGINESYSHSPVAADPFEALS